MLKVFNYRKPDGSEKERIVHVLSPISDMLLGVDLSEFDEDERLYYDEQLEKIQQNRLDAIKALGLNGNYRYFKESRIIN